MARVGFTVRQEWNVDQHRLWSALADWQGHGSWVPATTVRILEGDGGLGTRFVARTGIGPLAFDDNMTVVEFDPATTHAVVEKTGPLIKGSAGFRIEPRPGGCALMWFETVHVPGLPRILSPIAAAVGKFAFNYALNRLRSRL